MKHTILQPTKIYRPTDASVRRSITWERIHHPGARYRVVRYAADGHAGEQIPLGHSDGEIMVDGLSIDEAIAAARAEVTPGFGSWTPDGDGVVVGFHDSRIEGCGGYAICRQAI